MLASPTRLVNAASQPARPAALRTQAGFPARIAQPPHLPTKPPPHRQFEGRTVDEGQGRSGRPTVDSSKGELSMGTKYRRNQDKVVVDSSREELSMVEKLTRHAHLLLAGPPKSPVRAPTASPPIDSSKAERRWIRRKIIAWALLNRKIVA